MLINLFLNTSVHTSRPETITPNIIMLVQINLHKYSIQATISTTLQHNITQSNNNNKRSGIFKKILLHSIRAVKYIVIF